MSLFGSLGRLFRSKPAPDVLDPEYVDVPMWRARLWASQRLVDQEWPVWLRLEKATDGIYPALLTSGDGEQWNEAIPYDGGFRSRSGDQLDVNLMGRAMRRRTADYYDRFPQLTFTRRPSQDAEAVDAMEDLATKLLDEADAVPAMRRGTELAHTRGQIVLWPIFMRDRISEREIVAGKTPPAAFVESVLAGNPPDIPVGSDYDGILHAASQALQPIDKNGVESPTFLAMSEEQKNALTVLAMRAEKMARKAKAAPQSLRNRAAINVECTPYGSFCLVDPTVTDFSRVAWIARKIVMTREEFQNDPTFTDEAKNEVRPLPPPKSDGGVPVVGNEFRSSPDGRKIADEVGRVVLWEIWDKIGCRRIYIAEGYDKPVGKTTRYPYMDLFGRPLFPDFFPCVWRTPWSRMAETPARVLGLPGFEPMWSLSIEYIKCVSAFVIAAKSTARVFVVGPGVSDASLTTVAKAQDCSFVRFSAEYTPSTMGTPDKQFTQIPIPPAPIDYLTAAEKVKHEAFESVLLSAAEMTSSPQAGTATQEGLIQGGAQSGEAFIRSIFEEAFAELAWKCLILFLEFANPQQFEAFLGEEALQPRSPKAPPQEGPNGEMIPPPQRPSIYEVITSTDLVGERLEARFAPSTRASNAMRLKTLMDMLATVNNVRDGAGMPLRDPGQILDRLLKEADVDAGPYQPSEAEIAMAVSARLDMRNAGGSGDSSDSRKANGERGTPNSPGRQSRERGMGRDGGGTTPGNGHGPQSMGGTADHDAQSSGVQHRRATATA